MPPRVFVDTSAWVAAQIGPEDVAEAISGLLEDRAERLVTSAHVLTETWSLLAVRAGPALARAVVLDVSASASVLHGDAEAHQDALGIMRLWADQAFSYADATSFALMIRQRIDTAVTLDQHFRVFRHGRDRREAFHVLP